MYDTSRPAGRPGHQPGPYRPARRRSDAVVREPSASYDRDDAPFGLPVLAELAELGDALTTLAAADRALRQAVIALQPLLADGRIETATGVGLDHWLAATTRMTGLDRRLLRRMCRLLERLPTLADAAANDQVSFAQLRGLTLELHKVSTDIDQPLNTWLAAAIDQLPADTDPDVLVRQAVRAADELAPERLDRHGETIQRGLSIQPFLDGTGGTFHGTEDAIGLAILDAATTPTRGQLDNIARGRADNLQRRLRHACPDSSSVGSVGSVDGGDGSDSDEMDVELGRGPLAAPTLLLRMDLDALAGVTDTPADLLTTLTGGRLRVAAGHARNIIDTCGASIRTILHEHGEVIGVGRATRVPTRWLRHIALALHDTCTAPGCQRPAAACDLDHAIDWQPTPGRAGGPTDIDNLGPLCADTNENKRASGWQATQNLPGLRSWTHPRSGLSVTTVPTTWRPTGAPPPPRRRHRHPPSAPPPDHPPIVVPHSPRGIGPPRHDNPASADLPPPPDDPLPF